METDHGNRLKILPAVFFVGFTQLYIPVLIRAAQCWNKNKYILISLLKGNLVCCFYLLRFLCDVHYLLFKGNDSKYLHRIKLIFNNSPFICMFL